VRQWCFPFRRQHAGFVSVASADASGERKLQASTPSTKLAAARRMIVQKATMLRAHVTTKRVKYRYAILTCLSDFCGEEAIKDLGVLVEKTAREVMRRIGERKRTTAATMKSTRGATRAK